MEGFLTPPGTGRILVSPTDSIILFSWSEEGACAQGEQWRVKHLWVTKQNHCRNHFRIWVFLVCSESQWDLGCSLGQLLLQSSSTGELIIKHRPGEEYWVLQTAAILPF